MGRGDGHRQPSGETDRSRVAASPDPVGFLSREGNLTHRVNVHRLGCCSVALSSEGIDTPSVLKEKLEFIEKIGLCPKSFTTLQRQIQVLGVGDVDHRVGCN